jgi:ABC-type bacteriocin/lantibiotic exporter with double-glycine peptidase domain
MKKLIFEIKKQKNRNNCWAACLSMALDVFSIKKSENELAKNQADGLSLDEVNTNLSSIFKNNKIETTYRSELCGINPKLKFNEITEFIDAGKPILIGVYNYNGLKAHTLLIYGYDSSSETIAIADPWEGKGIIKKYSEIIDGEGAETLIIKH